MENGGRIKQVAKFNNFVIGSYDVIYLFAVPTFSRTYSITHAGIFITVKFKLFAGKFLILFSLPMILSKETAKKHTRPIQQTEQCRTTCPTPFF